MGSQEGMDFVIPCLRKVLNEWNMGRIAEGKVGDVKQGICYFTLSSLTEGIGCGEG
jgi:hypothetical protein